MKKDRCNRKRRPRNRPRKKRDKSKKIRAWYSSYRERCKENGDLPHPMRVWAALELDKAEPGSGRAREFARHLGNDYLRTDANREAVGEPRLHESG